MDHICPICSVPSEEVLLSVDVISTSTGSGVVFIVPPLLWEEIGVLLATTIEILCASMSMETTIMLVTSQLSVLLHRVVELTKSVLLIRASVVTSMVALVLLHREMRVLRTWNVLTCHLIIVTSELVKSFLVEIVTLRVKEITTWQNVETILVIFTWSVLNFLPGVFLYSRCRFLLGNLRLTSRCKAFL